MNATFLRMKIIHIKFFLLNEKKENKIIQYQFSLKVAEKIKEKNHLTTNHLSI